MRIYGEKEMNENVDSTIVICPICKGWKILSITELSDDDTKAEIAEAVKAGYEVMHKPVEEARQHPMCPRDHVTTIRNPSAHVSARLHPLIRQ